MKPLKPSMREKKRYLLIEGINLKENIEKALKDFLGNLEMSKLGLGWIKVSKKSAIISINRKSVDKVRAALVIWPEKITVKRVSGTLKGLNKK